MSTKRDTFRFSIRGFLRTPAVMFGEVMLLAGLLVAVVLMIARATS